MAELARIWISKFPPTIWPSCRIKLSPTSGLCGKCLSSHLYRAWKRQGKSLPRLTLRMVNDSVVNYQSMSCFKSPLDFLTLFSCWNWLVSRMIVWIVSLPSTIMFWDLSVPIVIITYSFCSYPFLWSSSANTLIILVSVPLTNPLYHRNRNGIV